MRNLIASLVMAGFVASMTANAHAQMTQGETLNEKQVMDWSDEEIKEAWRKVAKTSPLAHEIIREVQIRNEMREAYHEPMPLLTLSQ